MGFGFLTWARLKPTIFNNIVESYIRVKLKCDYKHNRYWASSLVWCLWEWARCCCRFRSWPSCRGRCTTSSRDRTWQPTAARRWNWLLGLDNYSPASYLLGSHPIDFFKKLKVLLGRRWHLWEVVGTVRQLQAVVDCSWLWLNLTKHYKSCSGYP